jgi:hypothetical protein
MLTAGELPDKCAPASNPLMTAPASLSAVPRLALSLRLMMIVIIAPQSRLKQA